MAGGISSFSVGSAGAVVAALLEMIHRAGGVSVMCEWAGSSSATDQKWAGTRR